jgi:N utilization substance protein B
LSDVVVKSRRAAREAAFQAVYQCACGGSSIAVAIADALSRQRFSDEAASLVRELAVGAITGVVELDGRYAPFLKSGWTPERLAVVDRLLLRMAVFELWSMPDVPPKVTITEAVNLAKRFGGAESGPFINGVLGKVLEVSPKREWEGSSEVRGFGGSEGEQDEPEQTQTNPDEPKPEASWTIRSDE